MKFSDDHKARLKIAAQERGQRSFRERYKNSKSTILELYPSTHHGGNGVWTRFLCHGCVLEKTENIRSRRKDDGDLLCGDCLFNANMATRADRGWKPHGPTKFTTEFVRSVLIERGVSPTFDQYTGPGQQLSFICGCGQPGQITWRNLYYQDPRTTVKATPRCPLCSAKARKAWTKEKCRPPVYRGADHPSYNPNLTDEERAENENRGPEFERWAEAVKRKNDYLCALTGGGGEMRSHHIFWWVRHPEARFDLANGVCVSEPLHRLFHSLYRSVDTVDEAAAWREFCARYQSGEFSDTPLHKIKAKPMTAGQRHDRYVRFRDSRTPEQQAAQLEKLRRKHKKKKEPA